MKLDDLIEDFSEHDYSFSVSARAVTGQDGKLLFDDIDVGALCSTPSPSKRREAPKAVETESPLYCRWTPPPPPQPRKVRNIVTGHVFDWSPAFTLSSNDDLEVIEWYGR